MTVTTLNNQSLADLTVQEYGQLDKAVLFAFENGISLTEDLTPGQDLVVAGETESPDIVRYYQSNGVKPATGLTEGEQLTAAGEDPCDLCKYFH
ncbi:MAG: hypothetical protein V7767_00680 [Leeuwenhoekiella sp.]